MARDGGKPTGVSEVRIPLAQLLPDPANVRLHPERNRKAVLASLRRFGAARSIVADGNLIVRAGNATLAEAAAAGIKTARVIRAHGDELIVVQRDDWDDTQATAYAIADNKATDESEFDPRALGLTLAALPEEEREATGFDAEELASLVGTAEPEPESEHDFVAEGDEKTEDSEGAADGPLPADAFVVFRFGDYSGRVGRPVYEAFVSAYQRQQQESGEPMMDDVLRAWLGV